MLKLTPSLFIAKGAHRECYVHSSDSNLCVKIIRDNHYKEMRREQSYYKLLNNRNISWKILPRFYGNVETNLGLGAVFDLIRDYDGEISKTLEYYLSSNEKGGFDSYDLHQALSDLKSCLIQDKIITMNIKARNIVYKKINQTEGLLIIVDDIGNSQILPIANYVDYFAEKKILRKWDRFMLALPVNFPDNEILRQVLTRSDVG